MTLPFTVLRHVKLEPSLGLSDDKRRAIDTLGYGTNAKTMIAFQGKPWVDGSGSNGSAVHRPDKRANDVGDQPDDAGRGVDPDGLRGRRPRKDAGARLGAGAGGRSLLRTWSACIQG